MAQISSKKRREIKQQVSLWLDMGWPRWRINSACLETFDGDPEFIDGLIREIRHELGNSQDLERRDFLAQQLTRLEALAVKAQEDGNLAVALGAFKEMHALTGLRTGGFS
jgi:hypothetical protein